MQFTLKCKCSQPFGENRSHPFYFAGGGSLNASIGFSALIELDSIQCEDLREMFHRVSTRSSVSIQVLVREFSE